MKTNKRCLAYANIVHSRSETKSGSKRGMRRRAVISSRVATCFGALMAVSNKGGLFVRVHIVRKCTSVPSIYGKVNACPHVNVTSVCELILVTSINMS